MNRLRSVALILAIISGCAPSTPPVPLTAEEQAKADARAAEIQRSVIIQSGVQQAIPSSTSTGPPGSTR